MRTITVCFFLCWACSCTSLNSKEVEAAKVDALGNDEAEAAKAIAVLKANSEGESLVKVIRESRLHKAKLLAADSLGDVGSKDDARALIKILKSVNTEAVEGGSEQRVENQEIKEAVIKSLAKICRVTAPAKAEKTTTEAFILQCEGALEKRKD